jgi:hypothetical protein
MIPIFFGSLNKNPKLLGEEKRVLKLAGLALASLFLTPILLGGAFFKTLNKQAPLFIGLLCLVFSAAAFGAVHVHLGVLVGALLSMVLLYSYGESRGISFFTLSGLSLCFGVVVWLFGTQIVFSYLNQTWAAESRAFAEIIQSQLVKAAGADIGVTAEQIQMQFPGSLLSFFILFLGFSVGFERKAHALFGVPFERYAGQLRPLEFRVPDFLLWVVLFGILFSIFDQVRWLQIIGENIITIGLAIYFFQGLAILEVFLLFLRVHPFLKFFTYFTLVGQLLLVISAIGFIDFWLDLRKKMRNSLQRT